MRRKKKEKKRKTSPPKQGTTIGKRNIAFLALTIGVLVFIYVIGVIYYGNHFYPGTTVDGISVAGMNARTAASHINDELASYELHIIGTETVDVITGNDIGYAGSYTADAYESQEEGVSSSRNIIGDYLDKQNPFIWPFSAMLSDDSRTYSLLKEFDEDQIEALVGNLNCMTEGVVASEPAYLDFVDGEYIIVSETIGTEIDTDVLVSAIAEAISNEETELYLQDLYIKPNLTADEESLISAMEHGNNILAMEFTLSDGVRSITVTPETLQTLLVIEDNAVKVDLSLAISYANSLSDLNPSNVTSSQDAYLYFQAGSGYSLAADTVGTYIDPINFAVSLSEAVDAETSTINAVYATADVTDEDETLISVLNAANSLYNKKITIQNDYASVTLTGDDIASLINVSGSGIEFDDNAIAAWVNENILDTFNTVGISRDLLTSSGETVTLSGGTYGNQVDIEGEVAQLTADLQNGADVTREPVYSYKEWGTSSENSGIGYTFVEVDLDAQMLYLASDGQWSLSTPIVSGDPTTGKDTPTGIYYIIDISTDSGMRHYNTEVLYWMEISDGFGLRDAGWRNIFGGNLYRGDGTDGIVEMSQEAAKSLYETISVGIPVIIHE